MRGWLAVVLTAYTIAAHGQSTISGLVQRSDAIVIVEVAFVPYGDLVLVDEILHGETLEPAVPCDPMLDMNHIVPHVEIFQGGKERGRSAFGLWFVACPFRKELLLRQECEAKITGEESRGQLAVQDKEGELADPGEQPVRRLPFVGRQVMFSKEGQESIDLSPTSGHQHHPMFGPEAIQQGEGLTEGRAFDA